MRYYHTVDPAEAIKKCLNCDKPECTNCLGYHFFDFEEEEEERNEK